MLFEIEDRVGNELAWAMKGGLAASQGFVEVCFAPRSILGEVGLLCFRYSPDVPSATCVDGVELSSDDGWRRRSGAGGVGFVGELLLDEALLDRCSVRVGSQAREMEMAKDHAAATTSVVQTEAINQHGCCCTLEQ